MVLQLRWAGAHSAPQGHDFPLHSHHEWEIVFYRAGHIQVAVGPERYDVAPGMVVLTPPGIAHAEYALTAYANIYLSLEAPIDHPWPRLCEDDGEQSLAYLFRSLLREWHAPQSDSTIMLDLLLQQLDVLLLRAATTSPLSTVEQVVADAERYMQEHYHRPLEINEIAQALGISSSTLRRHVMQVRGCAPLTLLQRLRVRHACEMLRTSDLTLEAIARLCGYDSASHLSRQVKSITGKRPGVFRTYP